jgi:hypothetical protein
MADTRIRVMKAALIAVSPFDPKLTYMYSPDHILFVHISGLNIFSFIIAQNSRGTALPESTL